MNSTLPHEPVFLASDAPPQRPFAWVGELAGFLRRHRMLLLACLAATVLLALSYLLTATPRFTASATLMVDAKQADLLQQHPAVSDAQIENALIESEVEVLRSPGLARKAVTALKLDTDPAFAGRPSALSKLASLLRAPVPSQEDGADASTARQDRLVQQFLGMVSPHRIGLTYVIEIDATASTTALAARLANGLMQAYLADQIAVRDSSARQAADWQEARLAALQDKALKADQQVQLFKSRSGIVDTGRGLLSEQQLIELNSQLIAARGRTAEATARLDRIRQMTKPGSTTTIAVSDVLKSPVVNGLREHYLNDAQRVAEWSARYGASNGAVVQLRREMVQLQASIDSEGRRIEQSAESDLAVARAGEAAIQAQLDRLVAQSASTDTARATLRSLQGAADTYHSLYTAFLQRALQTAQGEAFPIADARVVTEARPPLTKSRPQGKLVLAGSIVVGLGIGFALGLLREALDRRLRDGAGLLAETGLSCLAVLPEREPARFRFLSGRFRRAAAGAAGRPGVPAANASEEPPGPGIRTLQMRLQQQSQSSRCRLIGLIGPVAGAGTSTVAAGLVRSLGASGYQSCLLALSGSTGTQRQIREQLDLLRREHEFVVVDLPALDRPAEAHMLFSDVDHLVLVVPAGRLQPPTLLDTLRSAGLDRRQLAGVVLNRVRMGS